VDKILLPRLADLRIFTEATGSLIFRLRKSLSGSSSGPI
jgi:hypothetical protein